MEETENAVAVDLSFFNDVSWEYVKYNKINQENFSRIRAKHEKIYATFLGTEESLSFYMFTPLDWETYKELRTKEMNKYDQQELILKSCLVWPLLNGKVKLDAGTILTLVFQILAQSSFLKDPSAALRLVIEVS
jgi:hypothetical protein